MLSTMGWPAARKRYFWPVAGSIDRRIFPQRAADTRRVSRIICFGLKEVAPLKRITS